MKSFLKKPWFIVSSVIALLIVLGGGYYFFGTKKSTYDFIRVKKGNIVQEVSVTGKVKALNDVSLAFDKSGRISEILAKVGDHVYVGDALVRLESGDVYANYEQAVANLQAQTAKLDELKKGTRKEELALTGAKVSNAKLALGDAEKNLLNSIQNAYTVSDDSVRYKTDYIFSSSRSSSPILIFFPSDAQLKADIESGRVNIESLLNSWQMEVNTVVSPTGLADASNIATQNLSQVKSFIEKTAFAVNSLLPGAGITQANIDTWRSNISLARSNLNLAISTLNQSIQNLNTASSTLDVTNKQLALEQAGAVPEEIIAQESAVAQAGAQVDTSSALLAKNVIRSPINGIITKSDFNVGEIVSPNVPIVSMISEEKFIIEAFVPEVDISKVIIGNNANVTLDAYGSGVVFKTTVTAIDPAETVIEGVPTYKITIHFVSQDDRIRSGMTANIDISSAEHDNVLTIPQRAIIQTASTTSVLIDAGNNQTAEQSITIGLKGSNGNVEIVSGLIENQKVVGSGNRAK